MATGAEGHVPEFRIVHPLPAIGDVVATTSLNRVVRWWRKAPAGVCALVGIGGCGKTTITDEFLRRTGVLAARTPSLSAHGEPRPATAFLYSLEAASPETLFGELEAWLRAASRNISDLLAELGTIGRSAAAPLLIVIDGLEQVQSSGGKEGIGRLTDPRLRELITRCAYGALPGVAMLVTTRLALTDVEIQRLPLHTKIEMDAMDGDDAVALLRARGVGSARSELELRKIADAYGRHALTIDLAARYNEQYGRLPAASDTAGDVLRAYLGLVAKEDRELLGFLSLFRRGVSTSALEMFVENLGIDASGGLEPALRRLAALRLLTRAPHSAREAILTMHEVLRTMVEDDLDAALRRRWHTEIASAFVRQAQQRVHEMDIAERYDLLGKCIAHGVAGENPMWAAELYWQRIGNFDVVGHRDSQFSWGESACRTLNENRPPDDVADYLRDHNQGAGSAILADWGLYLGFLGDLASSLMAHEAAFREAHGETTRTIAASNIADICIQRGDLRKARWWAAEAQRHAAAIVQHSEGVPTPEAMRGFDECFEYAARADLYRTGAGAANAALDELASIHAAAAEASRSFNVMPISPSGNSPTFSLDTFKWGVPRGEVLLVRGDVGDATEIALRNLARWRGEQRVEEITSVRIRAVLVAGLLASRDTDAAIEHVRVMESWARANDARHTMAQVHLLTAWRARVDGECLLAAEAVAEGIRTARETGSGLLHIELLIESARISLELGEPDDAVYAAATALFGQEALSPGMALYAAPARDEALAPRDEAWYRAGGIFPPEQTGRPALLAATHPDCGYRWGEARAREMLGEGLLASLARVSQRADIDASLTPSAARTVAYARQQLERAATLFDELTGRTSLGDRVRYRLTELDSGRLTRFLGPPPQYAGGASAARPTGRRVLISYTRSDSGFVDALADLLSRIVDDVWVDRRKISVGDSFVAAINAALRGVTDFIVVLSQESARSLWVTNELNAAIALRNSGAPISIRPVVLDGIGVPPLLADLDILRASDRNAMSVLHLLSKALKATDEA